VKLPPRRAAKGESRLVTFAAMRRLPVRRGRKLAKTPVIIERKRVRNPAKRVKRRGKIFGPIVELTSAFGSALQAAAKAW
jgi:hypothetical protein